jgi:signal transduction histidine kinase
MSHELRTPLNAIIGFSEIFRDQLFGELGNPKYREYAGNILESGRHLLAIINGLLDLAKSDAGKLQLDAEPLDLRTIIDGCATMMREQCLRGQLQLNVERGEDELIVWGDAAKLRQILLNLLSNAAKFTEPGGRVSIAATAERDTIACRVADTGIGMAPEDIPVALTPFSQIDSRLARRYAGTGLGLPLTKALVNLHGGTMTIDSAPNRGTTVTVTLQRFSAADQPKRQAASA